MLAGSWSRVGPFLVHDRSSHDLTPGLPLVLVHGLGVSCRYLLPAAEMLAAHLPVLVPELPGWGESSTPPEPLGIPELARLLGEWADVRGVRRACFLGHSLGAQVVLELACARPALVAGLVLASPTPDPRARTIASATATLLLDIPREPASLWLVTGRDYLRFGPLRLLRTLRHMLRDPVESRLPHVRAPTLVVRGIDDPVSTAAWAWTLAGQLEHATVRAVPGAHAAHYAHPAPFAAAVLAWLREAAPHDRGPGG